MEKPLILEQHIHGAFGVDFNTATVDEVLYVADKLAERGIVAFFPTLVTDSIENLKQQISVIKEAGRKCKRIVGIHLEGVFINSQKKGIHNSDCFLPLTVENYKLIEDDFIKIVTLAPELDEGLIGYLKEKGIKVIEVENLAQLCSIENCKISGIKNKNISDIIENIIVE